VVILAFLDYRLALAVWTVHTFLRDSPSLFYISRLNCPVPRLQNVDQLGGRIISKTCMTRVEGENTRLRHYPARLRRKTLWYSKSEQMLRHSIHLLIHHLKYKSIP